MENSQVKDLSVSDYLSLKKIIKFISMISTSPEESKYCDMDINCVSFFEYFPSGNYEELIIGKANELEKALFVLSVYYLRKSHVLPQSKIAIGKNWDELNEIALGYCKREKVVKTILEALIIERLCKWGLSGKIGMDKDFNIVQFIQRT